VALQSSGCRRLSKCCLTKKETLARRKLQHKKAAFIRAFGKVATITHAARIAKIDRSRHYDWLDSDAEYAAEFAVAEEIALGVLEDEAWRRAVEGIREPVGFYKGKPSAYVRRYSDVLLIFLLKAAKPEKYRETINMEHGGKITHEHVVVQTIDPYGMALPLPKSTKPTSRNGLDSHHLPARGGKK
jgi:hypothetical protein